MNRDRISQTACKQGYMCTADPAQPGYLKIEAGSTCA